MTTFLDRSAWTGTSASGSTLTGSKLRGVAVHYPGTSQDVIGDPGQAAIANRLRGYRDFHVNTRGWSDIGYNFAIDQGGRFWMLRSTSWAGNRVGAHCASKSNPDANHEYVGVLLVIGDAETPGPKMIQAFRDWYRGRFLPVWAGRTDVRGHRQVPGASTSCPGNRAIALLDAGTFESGSSLEPEPVPIPTEDLTVFITPYGSSRHRLVADKVYGISEGTYNMFKAGGVPVKILSNDAIAGLELVLNGGDGFASVEAKLDEVLAALATVPGVDTEALAAAIAAVLPAAKVDLTINGEPVPA